MQIQPGVPGFLWQSDEKREAGLRGAVQGGCGVRWQGAFCRPEWLEKWPVDVLASFPFIPTGQPSADKRLMM